jgi:uncharacterized protein YxjI
VARIREAVVWRSPVSGDVAKPNRAYVRPMGILRHRDDAALGRRFQMQEKLASIGDDSWIEDDGGERLYKVDGKALRLRETFILKDRDGNEVAKIQEKKLRLRDTMKVERDGRDLATINKRLVGIRDHFVIKVEGGEDLRAHGNVVEHEYEVKRDDEVVARVSKRWFRVRDTYGVVIREGEDEPLLLAVTVALDEMTDR